MRSTLRHLWKRSSRYRIVFACTVLAAIFLIMPLQRQFPMGRYQHYSFGIGLFGLGYILQLVVSWPSLPRWGRVSYLLTGIFFQVVAWVFWTNPWLDLKVAVQTAAKEQLRSKLLVEYLMSSLVIALCWLKWWSQEMGSKQQKGSPESRIDG
jgi:hypothetical protein